MKQSQKGTTSSKGKAKGGVQAKPKPAAPASGATPKR